MAYFPFFMDLKGRTGLVVGGGRIALHKIEKLIPFEPALEICAPSVLPEIAAIDGLILQRTEFREAYLDGKAFVIAATDDCMLNRHVSILCREKNIPVNVVDDRDYCTFLFPSLVQKGSLTVGVCTGGASPTAARWTKERIADLIPERFDDILDYLEQQRSTVKACVREEAQRSAVFKELFAACMEKGGPLETEETLAILRSHEGMQHG